MAYQEWFMQEWVLTAFQKKLKSVKFDALTVIEEQLQSVVDGV
ncbi:MULTISPECIES: hypothetical protein [Nostoc]|nr:MULTISPECIES: hypothetical protein [Nostoc]